MTNFLQPNKKNFHQKYKKKYIKNSRTSLKKKLNFNIKNLKIILLNQRRVILNFKQIKFLKKRRVNLYKTNFFNKSIIKQGKFSYELYSVVKGFLFYAKEYFNSISILNNLSIKGLFEIKLNLNYLYQRLFILKKRTPKNVKNIFRKYIKNFLRKSKRLVLRKFNYLKHMIIFKRKKIAINKGIKFMLTKTLFKSRQRIFYILNYGFFFTFLLKSNSIHDFNAIFNDKFFLFGNNKFFLIFFLRKLFKNYFFINNFLGSSNRFFFNSRDITINFSDYFNLNMVNLSNYNSYKRFNFSKLNIK